MSHYKYIIYSIIITSILTGCAFTPTLSNDSDDPRLSHIAIAVGGERDKQLLYNALSKVLYHQKPSHDKHYYLNFNVQKNVSYLGLTVDEVSSIGEVRTTASFTLQDTVDRETILTFTLERSSSFVKSNLSAYAIDQAIETATVQTLNTIAHTARNRLLLFIENHENSQQQSG